MLYKVLVWGTGGISESLENEGINAEIIGYIQTNKTKDNHKNKRVYSVNEIPNEYDFIIVANSYEKEIFSECLKMGIDLKKVIFLKPIDTFMVDNIDDARADVLGEQTAFKWLNRGILDINKTFFSQDLKKYEEINTRKSFEIQNGNLCPCIYDKYQEAGHMDNYLWQDLWAAKLVYKSRVKSHFDIGSRIDGFITHLLTFGINVTLIDIRKYSGNIENLHFIQDDATSLCQIKDNSIESMSALCSLEHFGLGRYGDPIDPEACFKAFSVIQQKLRTGGHLYIAVPVGKERVEFNAHRIFYAKTIIDSFYQMDLQEYSCALTDTIDKNIVNIHKYDDKSDGMVFGLFHFIKR